MSKKYKYCFYCPTSIARIIKMSDCFSRYDTIHVHGEGCECKDGCVCCPFCSNSYNADECNHNPTCKCLKKCRCEITYRIPMGELQATYKQWCKAVSYTHLRAHETRHDIV